MDTWCNAFLSVPGSSQRKHVGAVFSASAVERVAEVDTLDLVYFPPTACLSLEARRFLARSTLVELNFP